MTDREGKADAQPYHLILLAKDWTGYQNLCRLVTDAHLDGYYYKPRIDRELPGAAQRGPHRAVGLPQRRGRARARDGRLGVGAHASPASYRDIFGPGNFFLELQDHGLPEQRRLNEQLLRLAPEVGLPLVATNDLHYVHRAQSEAHDVLLCVGTGSNLDTPGRMKFETHGLLPQDAPPRWRRSSRDVPEAIANTRRIAEMTDLQLDVRPAAPARLPGAGRAHGRELAARGVRARPRTSATATVTDELQRRLDYELDVIIRDGLRGLLPDRGRLRPLRARAAASRPPAAARRRARS